MRALMLVIAGLAACGGGSRQALAPDGAGGEVDGSNAPADAAVADAVPSDTGPGPSDVEVVVRDGFSPVAGVRVVFVAGSARAEVVTDASGIAISSMPEGGDVDVIRTYTGAQEPEIYSYVGVKAGDRLHAGHVTDDLATPSTITVTVPAPAQGAVTVATACGSARATGPNVHVSVAACPASLDVYVHDSAGDGFVAAATYGPTIDLSQQVMNGDLSTTVFAYDVTPDLQSVTAEGRAVSGTHALYSTGVKRVDQGSTQIEMPNLAGALDELVVGTMVATAGGTQAVGTRSVYAPMPVSVDGSGHLLPYLAQPAAFTATGATWTERGTGTPDAVIAFVEVTPAGAPHYRRAILAPYAGATLAIPQLDGADVIYNPAAGDTLTGTLGLAGSTSGYDALRPYAFGVGTLVDATTPGDTVTLSYASAASPISF